MLTVSKATGQPTRVPPEEMGLKPRPEIKARMMELGLNGKKVSALSGESGFYLTPSVISGLITGRINPYLPEKRVLSKILRCPQKDLFSDGD